MKHVLQLLSAAFLIISGCVNCTNASADTFKLNLELSGVEDSTKVLIRPITHIRNTPPLADGVIIGGKATLTGNVDIPTPVYLFFSNGTSGMPAIVENGTVTVKGDIRGERSRRDENRIDYNYDNIEILGSKHYPTLKEILDTKKRMGEELFAIRRNELYIEAQKAMGEAYESGDQARIEKVKNSEGYKAYEEAEHKHMLNLEKEYAQIISKHKDTFWGPAAMLTLYVYFVPDMRPLYEQFSDEAKASKFGKEVMKELYPVGRLGDKLHEFISLDAEGNSISMQKLASDNKLLLIDFWASWCKPCRKEIPHLKKIYEKYHDRGFDILSVSIDENDQDWRKALVKENMPWTNCRDTEKDIRSLYGVQSIPMLVVVDKDGRMVLENLRGDELSVRIGELLKE